MSESQTEAERVEAAIEDAVAAVEEGDRLLVAADWAAEQHGVAHRFADVHDAVREETDQEADDGD